jgi:hypothetical protein
MVRVNAITAGDLVRNQFVWNGSLQVQTLALLVIVEFALLSGVWTFPMRHDATLLLPVYVACKSL